MNSKAMHHLTYGLYLLSAQSEGKDNACIINTAVQVANDPSRISIAAIVKNHTRDMILSSGSFNLSSLSVKTPFSLFRHFGMQSGRDVNKFASFPDVARSENGLYYLTQYATSFLSAKVTQTLELGSHTLFIAEVTDGEVLCADDPCTYAFYQKHIKPRPVKSEKTAWVCSVCGYVYEGEEMPEDFLCPLCSHGKKDFQMVSAGAAPAPAAQAAAGKYVCSICGYVHEGDGAPDICPICKAPASKFTLQSAEKVWAAEHVTGVSQGAPDKIMTGLRENFTGECTEVGMYLAMARVAHREGYPEIGKYWEKAGLEEAEHAAKFAELLGEVLSASTEKNLLLRIDAEHGATRGKFDLANKARELGLDAIADTVMEMARDEARHGKALEGLLKRCFGK